MALNIPSNFSSPGAGPTSLDYVNEAARSISSIIKTPQEKFIDSLKDEITGSLPPLENAWALPFDEWAEINPATSKSNIDFTQIENAGRAYLDWKKNIRGRAKKFGSKNQLLNHQTFKQAYDEEVTSLVPELAQSIVNFHQINGKSDAEMRVLINKNRGLKELLINTGYGAPMLGEANNPLYPWLTEPEGYFKGLIGKMQKHPGMSAAAAYALYRGGKAYGPGMASWMKGKMPTGFKWPWGGAGGGGGGAVNPSQVKYGGKQLNLFNQGGNVPGAKPRIGGPGMTSRQIYGPSAGGTVPKSQAVNIINKLGGKGKVTQMLSNTIGKSGALKVMGGLLSKANVPLTLISLLWMIASQDKNKYEAANQANLREVLNKSQVNITGLK